MSNKVYNWRGLNLQSMDNILCAGNSRLSKKIQKMQRFSGWSEEEAKITHVAGVRRAMYGESWLDLVFSNSGFFVQESTTLNKFSGKKGVQLNPFDLWLENYDGDVYVQKLDFKRSVDFHYKDDAFWSEHKYDKYESGISGGVELLLCGLGLHKYIPWYTPMRTKELHCTEKHAMRIDAQGLWQVDIKPNRMPPAMWLNRIQCILSCEVSEAIKIKSL